MKRHLSIALFGLIGVLSTVNSAEACCHKKKCPTPVVCAAPVPVCAPAPVCIPEPVCAPVKKKCCFKMPKFKMPKMGGFCHKKRACAPVCETAWPVQEQIMPSAQGMPSAQTTAAAQG